MSRWTEAIKELRALHERLATVDTVEGLGEELAKLGELLDRAEALPEEYEIPRRSWSKMCECGVAVVWVDTPEGRVPLDPTTARTADGKPVAQVHRHKPLD